MTDGDFYRQDHQLIFRALADMANDQQPFDVVTVPEWMKGRFLDNGYEKHSFIDDASEQSPATIRSRCYQLMQQTGKPLTAILIDYVQLMHGVRKQYPNREAEVAAI